MEWVKSAADASNMQRIDNAACEARSSDFVVTDNVYDGVC